MKIAHVINTLAGAGAERVALDVFDCLKGYDQEFIVAKNIIDYNIDFEPNILYNKRKKPFYIPAFIYEKILLNKLSKALKDFDVIISHLRDMNTRLCLLKSKNLIKAKLIIVEHVTKELYSKKEIKYIKSLYKYADIGVGVSEKVVKDLEEYGVKKTVLIENAIDHDKIKTLSLEEDITFDKFSFLSVGRLSEDKDYPTLLKAFKIANVDAHLFIIGEGSKKQELLNLSKSLRIEDKVKFLGFKKNPFPYVRACDVFVSSSKRESFSMVVLEAMGLGKAVICTDVVPFAKDGFNALVVQKEDEEALSKALIKIYQNKNLRDSLSQNAFLFSQSYSKSYFCEKYKNIITML
jgi:N-acetylgalactosamine-N,N'-diacetylbacillosaminyl-diphospho-undecaprenol 4-alpha-N-acetylgalactosaminyltransferase